MNLSEEYALSDLHFNNVRPLEWKRLKGRSDYRRKIGNHQEAAELRKQMRQLPSGDPYDPGFRRLRYTRYADDFLLGFIGSKAEAEQIKESLRTFLGDTLKLELSKDKTLITHATSQAAKFLGYELKTLRADDKLDPRAGRVLNGKIGLRVPAHVIEQYCRAYMKNGKPANRPDLLQETDYTILSRYQAVYRGIVQYYLLAHNVPEFGKLLKVMQESLARTLANKHKTTCTKVFRRYKSVIQTEHGERTCLKVEAPRGNGKRPYVAHFGGVPLKRNRQAVLTDQTPQRFGFQRNELVTRLLAEECEMCESKMKVEVHHVRALRDLNVKGRRPKPQWVQIMAARKRLTLVVCRTCHVDIHHGRSNPRKQR